MEHVFASIRLLDEPTIKIFLCLNSLRDIPNHERLRPRGFSHNKMGAKGDQAL